MCFGLIGLDIVLRLALIEKKTAAKWDGITVVETPHDIGGNEGQITVNNPLSLGAATKMKYRVGNASRVIKLLISQRVLAGLWGALVQALLLTAFEATLPLRVRQIFHWDSLGAGLVFLPAILPTFAAPIIGSLGDKYGSRYFAATGFVLASPLLICLRFVTHDSVTQKIMLLLLLFLLGVANLVGFPPLMAEITYCIVEKEKQHPGVFGEKGAYALAYALFNMAFAGGCLIGPIWGGFVKNKAGWGVLCWTLGLFSAFTAVPTVLWVGGWIGQDKRSERDDEERREQSNTNDISTEINTSRTLNEPLSKP
jgi:hypothetical protein